MILTGQAIRSAVEIGDIVIEPFVLSRVNPNSVDVTLGRELLVFKGDIIDPAKKPLMERREIPPDGVVIQSGEFALGSTAEVVGSNKYVPLIHGKSGVARAGLFVHVTADLIDIGSMGNLTLQLMASLAIRLYADMPIAQISFWVPSGDIELYRGKYQGSVGPQPSRIHMDPFFANRRISND